MCDYQFINHGAPVKACEPYGSALICGKDHNWYFVIKSKQFILNINLTSQKTTQVKYENKGEGMGNFASKGCIGGYFYTSDGNNFIVFDPYLNCVTETIRVESPSVFIAMRLEPAPNGKIYMVSYPDCVLREYDKHTKKITELAVLDRTQHYCTSLVWGNDGYLYAGIGTEKNNIVAYNIKTKKVKALIPDKSRTQGGYIIYEGEDKQIYFKSDTFKVDIGDKWGVLKDGKITDTDVVFPGAMYVDRPEHNFYEIHSPTGKKSVILEYSVDRYFVRYKHPNTGERIHLKFRYQSEGANLSPLVDGGNGLIYGTSNHPLHFYSYDTVLNTVKEYKDEPLKVSVSNTTIGTYKGDLINGNICTYARYKNIIGGAAYSGGYVLLFDCDKPVKSGENPINVATYEQMHRPRGCAFAPDGKIFACGGFGGYGSVGGAMCLYNMENKMPTLISHQDLAEYESPICMDFINNNLLAMGTSVECPGGATRRAKEASVIVWDAKKMKKIHATKPFSGVNEIRLLKSDSYGLLHCFTNARTYFVYDWQNNKIVHRYDIPDSGITVQNGLIRHNELLFIFMTGGIFKIDIKTRKCEKIYKSENPITMGGAYVSGRFYFASRQYLCSIRYV